MSMFGGTVGHFRLDSWILANIIHLATETFCLRFLNLPLAPKGWQAIALVNLNLPSKGHQHLMLVLKDVLAEDGEITLCGMSVVPQQQHRFARRNVHAEAPQNFFTRYLLNRQRFCIV